MGTYKTSTIRLYQATPSSNWELLPHKLFIVDDIESYLATKTFNTYTLVQYQKPTLELSIVLDLSQTYAEPLNSGFKYARIENSDDTGHYYYYFIKSIDWRAKSAVRFNLVMDVLNTFKEGTHYSFKDSTKITREHKDRFILDDTTTEVTLNYYLDGYEGALNTNDEVDVKDENNTTLFSGIVVSADQYKMTLTVSLTVEEISALLEDQARLTVKKNEYNYYDISLDSVSYNVKVFRNIDYVPENINPPLQCGSSEGKFIQHKTSKLAIDWYLLYRNQNDPTDSLVNPVDCFLIPSENINVDSGYVENGRIVPSFLEEGKYYFFSVPYNTNTYTLSNGVSLSDASASYPYYYLLLTKSNNKIVATCFSCPAADSVTVLWQYSDIDYITVTNLPAHYYVTDTFSTVTYYYLTHISFDNDFNNSGTYNTLDTIDELDRTDAKNIKLIKLPYVPYNFSFTGTTMKIVDDDKWELAQLTQSGGGVIYVLKLKDITTKLNSEINSSYLNEHPLRNLYRNNLTTLNPQNTTLRSADTDYNNESKLFNSEFYRPTYIYDSFQYVVQLEKCNMTYYIANGVTSFYIDFDVTRTINSKFMFTFKTLSLRNATENYAKYMPIARNNEEVLYNVPYINYIRTGYNYDIKNRNLSNLSNVVGLGLSTAGMVASFVVPSAPLKALGIVTSLISMAMSVKNTISSAVSNQMSIDRKLQETKMQTASVSGSDDVDLMSVYAENRLKYLVYEPTAIMKNMLYNLFFFAGYNSQRMGLPSHNTRLNFDYLECDAVINKIANIPDECLTELVNAFKYGVTYIHKTTRTTDKWDFEQKYENWEKSLGVE